MKRIKNLYKTGLIGMIALGLTFSVAAQRHGGGGGERNNGGGGERSSGHFDRPQQQSQPSMEQPRQSAPMAQERHEVMRPQREQQNFPRNNQQGGSRSEGPRNNAPVAQQGSSRQAPIRNFPSQQQQNNRSYAPMARNNNSHDYRPGNNSNRNNDFRPVSTNNNRSFGGRSYDNHYRDRAWGYGYNHYDRRPVAVNRFYFGGAYHPHPYYYRPFTANWGIHINILPIGYYPFTYGSYRFFYNDGIFYQPYNGYYETVEPPLGAYIPGIPSAAAPIVINGQDYYEYNGTYYQRVYNNTQPYEVVGVNGYLQNDLAPATPDDNDVIPDGSVIPDVNADLAPSTDPAVLSALPENFRTVTLNNITYYVSPSGEYYTKNIDENGKITYIVAAIENGG